MAQDSNARAHTVEHHDPICTCCGQRRSAIGGAFYEWRHDTGSSDEFCDVCHHKYLSEYHLSEELARHVATWRRAEYMTPEDLQRLLDDLGSMHTRFLVQIMEGGTLTGEVREIEASA